MGESKLINGLRLTEEVPLLSSVYYQNWLNFKLSILTKELFAVPHNRERRISRWAADSCKLIKILFKKSYERFATFEINLQ